MDLSRFRAAPSAYSRHLAQDYATGIDKDLVKAREFFNFFNLASTRRHPDALQTRQAVEAELSKEQVTQAQRFARAWRPEPDAETQAGAEKKQLKQSWAAPLSRSRSAPKYLSRWVYRAPPFAQGNSWKAWPAMLLRIKASLLLRLGNKGK